MTPRAIHCSSNHCLYVYARQQNKTYGWQTHAAKMILWLLKYFCTLCRACKAIQGNPINVNHAQTSETALHSLRCPTWSVFHYTQTDTHTWRHCFTPLCVYMWGNYDTMNTESCQLLKLVPYTQRVSEINGSLNTITFILPLVQCMVNASS